MLCVYFVSGFYGYAMCSWIYGLFFGCYLYSSKIFCYSIVKTKEFSRTWSIVQASQSLPSLLGITITGIDILGIPQDTLKASIFAYYSQPVSIPLLFWFHKLKRQIFTYEEDNINHSCSRVHQPRV